MLHFKLHTSSFHFRLQTLDFRLLEVPPDWARPALGGEVAFELDLAFGEIRGIGEMLSSFRAVDIDHAQLVPAVREIADFVPEKLTAALKPPEHRPSGELSAGRADLCSQCVLAPSNLSAIEIRSS